MSVIMVNFQSTTVPFFFAKINIDMIYFFNVFSVDFKLRSVNLLFDQDLKV